jgi:hypothetical protein
VEERRRGGEKEMGRRPLITDFNPKPKTQNPKSKKGESNE